MSTNKDGTQSFKTESLDNEGSIRDHVPSDKTVSQESSGVKGEPSSVAAAKPSPRGGRPGSRSKGMVSFDGAAMLSLSRQRLTAGERD